MKRQKSFQNEDQSALYLVPTPIGNMQEISPRVLETLKNADVIACEDTRNSGILLKNLEIKKPLIAHHEFNQDASIPGILALLEQNKKVAIISDAGYPLISDPGNRLVQEVIEQDYPVISMSGANAALNALVASGLETSRYLFYGFLDSKSSKRKKQLEELKMLPYTLVFYEAPHRISDMLEDGLEVLGNRKICLARELTKKHEEFIRGSISEVLEVCEELKGEMVVVIEGAKKEDLKSSMEEAMNLMKEQIANGKKPRAAAKAVSEMTKIGRNELYSAYLELNQE
ncbi:16S rRNA (cytidine(1402)-2'-O)-methyltransferase [Ileibacterium valens]|uniref:16S rRNA (cytidine(1402)-2'-O)-methyltransferase n=2 Tax=Ileibacterium valens TaxID=1862668 RepID=UPI00256FCC86|nr:16S rRNA (cytidine(1402)-2'-O)-methyltransferase [Ileibacterium valens]